MMRRAFPCSALAIGSLVACALLPGTSGAEEEFDINKVFWCEAAQNTGDQTEAQCVESRELILYNCTACHAITPIVKAQKNKQEWVALLQVHRTRVPHVSEEDLTKIRQFLQTHFNPENPVPKLPPELDALGVPP